MAATVWVVAGCLFEVSLPAHGDTRWRWANPGPEVALLAEEKRHEEHRFRFRAEAAGANAGQVELRFEDGGTPGAEETVVVHVAPEHLPT